MIEKNFKVTLLTDVVVNSSLATEQTSVGTLDYIPGSNFLGIVANSCYDKLNPRQTYSLFHSGCVTFGDAYVLLEGERSLPIPFCLFIKKGGNASTSPIYLFHQNPDFFSKQFEQFEQLRNGFFTISGKYIERLPRRFSLKSAFDRSVRRSKDEAMFGIEALSRGLEFSFTVRTSETDLMEIVTDNLLGYRHVGKSKSAQFSLVHIEQMENALEVPHFDVNELLDDQLIVYAASNLCLFNENGVPTQVPAATHFGVKGKVNFERSQILTHSYCTLNSKRNAINMRRDCIKRGSIIVIDLFESVQRSKLPALVGGYKAEGNGWVIYNPNFLKVKDESKEKPEWNIKLQKIDYESKFNSMINVDIKTPILRFLMTQCEREKEEQKIVIAIKQFMETKAKFFQSISPSQWGLIRQCALSASNMEELYEKLFGEVGVLTSTASRRQEWDSLLKDDLLQKLKNEFESRINEGFTNTDYVVVLASEMAKFTQK